MNMSRSRARVPTVAWVAAAGAGVFGASVAGAYLWARSRDRDADRSPASTPRSPTDAHIEPTRRTDVCDVEHTREFREYPPLARGRASVVRTHAEQLAAYLRSCGAALEKISIRELTLLPRTGEYAIPPREVWPRVARTVRVWERIRARYGSPIEITSAYRPSDYNRTIGGQPKSLHVMGAGLDFTVEPARREQLVRATLAVFHERGPTDAIGLGVYGYPGVRHIHMDTGNRYRVFEQTPSWRKRYPPAGLELPASGPWSWGAWSGKTQGSGPTPIIAFHGMAATNQQLSPFLTASWARFWLVEGTRQSRSGGWNYFHSRSSSRSFAIDLRSTTDDLIPLVDAIERRASVAPAAVGYSQGGHLAFALAVRGHVESALVAAATLPESLWPAGGPPARLRRLVVLHGAADRVVPLERTARLARALEARGWPIDFIELPGVGHNIDALGPAIAGYLEELRR